MSERGKTDTGHRKPSYRQRMARSHITRSISVASDRNILIQTLLSLDPLQLKALSL